MLCFDKSNVIVKKNLLIELLISIFLLALSAQFTNLWVCKISLFCSQKYLKFYDNQYYNLF